MLRIFPIAAAILVLAACQQNTPVIAPMPDDTASAIWTFEQRAPALRQASCPDDLAFARASSIEMNAAPVELGPPDLLAQRVSGVRFVAGWHLTSAEDGFGGLSGLAVLPSGSLLAISDQGNWVWIAMENGAPSGVGNIAPMRNADGKLLSRKSVQDAEGLTMRDGLALVSFERNHRILAYDLEGCGPNARGALVTRVEAQPGGMARQMEPNGGLEGLALSAEGHLIASAETQDEGIALGAVAVRADGASLTLPHRHEVFGPLAATGLDFFGDDLLMVHRHYDRAVGNTVRLTRTPVGDDFALGESETLVRLDHETLVDNFEAVAVDPREGGSRRVYILSDNNFNPLQRTLLLAFEIEQD